MKKEVIITAKTVEEAVALAVTELGAPSADKIEYTVLEEPKKGFLGLGATDAKISATYTAGGQARAIAFVRQLLSDMNIEAEIAVTEGGKGEVRIAISGERAAVLIGHHGETLDSLQYLANLAANKRIDGKKEEYTKVSVDVEGYRAKREDALRHLAGKVAGKVLKYRRNITLEPMNAYERHVIHSALQETAYVTTYSIGTEPNRRVVVSYDRDKR